MSTDPQHPYSQAVVAGGLVFVSGSLPVLEDGTVVADGRAALDAAVENMKKRMATVGADLADVVKVTYYVTDIALRDAANQQFLDLWQDPRPARTVIGVHELPYQSIVEIDAVARAH
ncbi:RidA family protein [Saccharopolyspora sp. K220]|uniref:RidA family protein n=1 Tax=Saccharopolyspora soli TaxID=2926618 RepID=UPI001F59E27A|nr:RidA family protein [Saccharopolyspora soli]MCI2419565.1 RidA family protein [Saccharopolyspora soli]